MTKFSPENPEDLPFFHNFPPHSDSCDRWSPGSSGGKRRSKAPGASNEPQMVQIRNARERSRVRAVNEAYEKLRKVVPAISNRRKRVSKVKTLRKAAQYIQWTRSAFYNIIFLFID
uniref:BHLH domain-containing protein n=1 Tax=Lutzomyia longipalpis TaxID=7200 RepID=A0A1B0CK60_LUTLO